MRAIKLLRRHGYLESDPGFVMRPDADVSTITPKHGEVQGSDSHCA